MTGFRYRSAAENRGATPPTAVSRRTFLSGVGATGVGALLTACGGAGSTAPTSSAAPGTSGGATTVSGATNFYHWRSEDRAVLDGLGWVTFANAAAE